MNLCRAFAGLVGAVLWLSLAQAAQPERERLAGERAAANARLAEQERACREKFVVTACVDAARAEHRATLARLRRAGIVLDDAERHEAAARRREAVQAKAGQQAARVGAPAASGPRERLRAAPQPNPPAPGHPGGSDRVISVEERRASEQRHQAAFDERARAAQAHREAVERRNAQRAAGGKVAAPLPVPSAPR